MKNAKIYQTTGIVLLFGMLTLLLKQFGIDVASVQLHHPNSLAFKPAILPLRSVLAFIFVWYSTEHMLSGIQFKTLLGKLLGKFNLKEPQHMTGLSISFGVLELCIAVSYITGFYLDIFAWVATALLFMIIGLYFITIKTFLFNDIVFFGASVTVLLLTLSY